MQPILKSALTFAFGAVFFFSSALPGYAQDEKSSDVAAETEVLGDGLYAFRYGQRRSYFLVSATGVIVVDPLSVEAAKAMKQEIANVTAQPVKYVAYSNSLFHRSEGGQVFKDDGAEVVAHEVCAEEFDATPNPDVVPPDITFEDTYEITVGNQTLALYGLGRSYGDCYTAIVARNAKVILLPDLVTPPQAALPADPTIANYYIYRIIPVFERAEEIAAQEGATHVAGGTAWQGEDGAVAPATAPVSLIAAQRGFWETLLGAVTAEAQKGTPAAAIGKQLDMTAFDQFAGYDPRAIEIMTRRVYSLYRIGR